MKNSLLIKNIKHLVTCDENDNLFENVNIYIENGEIIYIGNEEKVADQVIDATGMAVYPGLINTHPVSYTHLNLSINIPDQFVQMLPYILTLLVLIGVGRKVKGPEALGEMED